jgi:hypothetical protein
MMVELPFRLHYELSRGQRIRPHLRAWALFIPAILAGLFACVVGMVTDLRWYFVCLGFLFVLVCFRGFFVGLLQIAFIRSEVIDVTFDEQGMIITNQHVHMTALWKKLWRVKLGSDAMCSVGFSNGVLVHIPGTLLCSEQIAFLQQQLAQVGRRVRSLERTPSAPPNAR